MEEFLDVATIRWIFDYNRWVNGRLLSGVASVPVERTREQFGASFDSIHGTLAHILSAEVLWLSRWRGVSPTKALSGDDFADVAAIVERWHTHQRELDGFVVGLGPERVSANVRYTNASGKRYVLPLWQLMLHVVNHGTHHRSELAEMLTRIGVAPSPTDMSVYLAESTGQI
jgi:uncharacterized damage-inducible protein DinB